METAPSVTCSEGSALTRLDWSVDVHLPDQHARRIFATCLSGRPDLEVRTPHQNVLLCGLPKSASLYVTQLLGHALALQVFPIGFDLKGGSLYYPRLLLTKFTERDTISHCHAIPDPTTLGTIRSLELRTVVLTRDPLDALVSRRDMLVRDGYAGNLLSPAAVERFLASTPEEQMDVVIDVYGPIYLNFLAAWEARRGDAELGAVFASYEELVADEAAFVERIAGALGRPSGTMPWRAKPKAIS